MIILTRITDFTSCEYRFIEELLIATFPREEYRDLHEQRNNVATKREFHLMLAYRGKEPIGFISYWELGEFCYVEHLATLPSVRGCGMGREILEQLKGITEKIVLEVEEPVDELTIRRINFYRRAGFNVCPLPYEQPPYRAGDGKLPMRLMFHGCPADKEHFTGAKELIYKQVYNYKE